METAMCVALPPPARLFLVSFHVRSIFSEALAITVAFDIACMVCGDGHCPKLITYVVIVRFRSAGATETATGTV